MPSFSGVSISWGGVIPQAEHLSAQLSASKTTATSTIYFTGDVMLGRAVERIAEKEGWKYPFAGIEATDLFADATAVVINFEGTASDTHTPTPNYQFSFSFPSQALTALMTYGVTHAGLANNHSHDFGSLAYHETQQNIAATGIVPFGDESIDGGSVTKIETEVGDVAVIAVYALNGEPDYGAVKKLFQTLSASMNIVYVHWGEEYAMHHNDVTEHIAEHLVLAGADIVVGHHPHVVQDVQIINGVPVFYSLGNFIFDQYFDVSVQTGLVLGLDMGPYGKEIRLLPVESFTTKSQPWPLTGVKKTLFLNSVARTSNKNITKQLMAGTLILPVEVAK